jgi:hypothetical protein
MNRDRKGAVFQCEILKLEFMPYEITVGSSSTADVPGSGRPGPRNRFQQLKSIVLAVLSLCVIAGLVVAVFLIGIVFAAFILLGILAAVCVVLVSRLFRRGRR